MYGLIIPLHLIRADRKTGERESIVIINAAAAAAAAIVVVIAVVYPNPIAAVIKHINKLCPN